jgi:hypothetical protein
MYAKLKVKCSGCRKKPGSSKMFSPSPVFDIFEKLSRPKFSPLFVATFKICFPPPPATYTLDPRPLSMNLKKAFLQRELENLGQCTF